MQKAILDKGAEPPELSHSPRVDPGPRTMPLMERQSRKQEDLLDSPVRRQRRKMRMKLAEEIGILFSGGQSFNELLASCSTQVSFPTGFYSM